MMTPYGHVLSQADAPIARELFEQRVGQIHNLRAGGGLGNLTETLRALSNSSIDQVVIQSQITPPIVYTPDALLTPKSGISNWLMRNVIKPSVTINTKLGPVKLEAYGPPTQNYFGPLVILAAIGGTVGGYFLLRGVGVIK